MRGFFSGVGKFIIVVFLLFVTLGVYSMIESRPGWVLAIGFGFIYQLVGRWLYEKCEDSFAGTTALTIVFTLITALARVIFDSSGIAIKIFYGFAVIMNAALCAAMSVVLAHRGYQRHNESTPIYGYYSARAYLREREGMERFNVFFMWVNIIIYCILAIFGFGVAWRAFLPLIYVVIRLVYVKIRMR